MKSKDKKKSCIQDLLNEKEKIEKSIVDQFQEYVAIMFTDIVGYTNYVETHGDIAAKSFLQLHNEIVFSIIEKHSGNIIKTIGDAVMASFIDTKKAVIAGIEIQKALKQYNETAENVKKINIRIGINTGNALKDGDDYFGDAVNIAARIEPAASAGQVMVSKSVYNLVKYDNTIFCSYHGLKKVKGKSEALELYRVFLTPEEQRLQEITEPQTDSEEVIETTVSQVMRFDLLWKVSLPVTLLLIFLFVYPGFLNRIHTDSNEITKKYVDGFMSLRNGNFEGAKKKFLDIGTDDPRSIEGLAALSYKFRRYVEANQLSEKSLKLNANILYPRVIKGNILFGNGKYDKAKQLYSEATNLETPIKWQKGEAFFRLGRISSFQNDSSEALEYYNKAIEYDGQNTDIIAAKGVLLEKMGELSKALDVFRTARNIAPNNAYVNAFYKSIQQKITVKQDKEKQERIDTLVNELIYNMKKNNNVHTPSDRWTSKPVTLFFALMERKGVIPLREGQDDFFKLELTEGLRGLETVNVVDRDLLDKLLQELKMSSSDLVDSSAALELGRIISARLIGNLTFIAFENETRLYVKLIETETTAILVSISEKFDNDADLDNIIMTVIAQIDKKLKSAFPIRGKINHIDGHIVSINIGANIGVQVGMVMRVYSNSTQKTFVGAIKVVAIEKDKSKGEIIKGLEEIKTHYLLEAVSL
jgi:class 3 adenylate cyclase